MTAPALFVAIPLVFGVVAGSASEVSPRASVSAMCAAWSIGALALYRDRHVLLFVATLCGFAAAGAATGAQAIRTARQPSLLTWYRQLPRQEPVRVAGILREDARRTHAGVTLVVHTREAGGVAVNGGLRVTVAGVLWARALPEWRGGRSVVMDVALREPLDYRNPGVPSDRERLARDGIVLVGSVKSAALVSITARGGRLSEAAGALRAFVRGATAQSIAPWSRRSSGVATAILIGDRGGLDAEDERRLQEAGTYHVIAISGGNIALLTGLLVLAGRAARLPARHTACGAILVLAFYGYAAGLAPSVLRATLAGIVYLAGRASDHRGGALNAVGVAAAIAAVAAPLTLLDPAFVLSFGATLAIVIGATRFAPARVRDRRAGWWHAGSRYFIEAARMLFAATVCAELALAPVGARLFGRVSAAGLLLNFAAIPLMSIIQVAGLAVVAAAAVSAGIASAGGFIAHAATLGLLRSARLVDVAPWLVLDLPPPALWLMAAWYGGWGLMLLLPSRRRLIPAGVVILSGLLMVAGRPATRAVSVPPAAPGWTRVVFLDVGQGDATVVQPSGGPPMLVDAGGVPGSRFDLGRRVTLPAAWAFGVIRLGPLVLTHGDPDHVGGAPPLLRALRPMEMWDGVPVPAHAPMRRLRAAAADAGVPWIERRAGESWIADGMRISVLNPPPPDWERPRVRNDDSIVLEIRIGDVAFLLPGDITNAVEPAVIAGLTPAPLTIVKAPHHGSAGSSSTPFVEALRPAAVIFSAGKRNPFGHPAPAVVARYRAAGAALFSTADDGAVVADTDGQRVVMWTWGSRRAVTLASQRRHEGTASQRRHEGTASQRRHEGTKSRSH